MSDQQVDQGKRTWLIATGCAGAVGGVATAVPFVSTFAPSERAKAAGAPVEVDISGIKPGEKLTVEWRGKPVWIIRRTPEQLAALPTIDSAIGRSQIRSARRSELTPEYVSDNEGRSIKPEFFVVSGHLHPLGLLAHPKSSRQVAQASLPDDWKGGFLCPCHGSTFDLAGRVFKNKPAPDNLEVPPHMYLSDSKSADR